VSRRLHPAAVAQTSEQARTARNLVDRIAALFPWIQRVGITVTVRLPTRMRTFMYRDAHRRVFAWFNRRDWELNTLAMDPDRFTVTSGDPQRWQLPGPRDTYRGVDAVPKSDNPDSKTDDSMKKSDEKKSDDATDKN
jgi:hypothetical protein